MVAHVRARREEGIRRFQLKLGADPREDAARVRAVLEATEEGDVIVADANGGWRLQDATIAARALEGLDRVLFEQPCPTLEECLIVRERTTLPMVLDEVITDVNALLRARPGVRRDQPQARPRRRAHEGQAAARPRDRARACGFTIEDSWGGDLTTAAVAHLAASTKPDAAADGELHERLDARPHRRLRAAQRATAAGRRRTAPGLGVTPDVDALTVLETVE